MDRDSRDTRDRDAMGGGARYQAPIAAVVCGAVGQLPRAAGVRLGGRRGTGSHWGCLKAAASNGTSERAVPRSGPPSCSTVAAACPSPGAAASQPGAQQLAGTAPGAAAWSLLVSPASSSPCQGHAGRKPSSLPWHHAARHRCCTPGFTQHPQLLVIKATAAPQEQGRSTSTSLWKLPHKSRYSSKGFS